jgi:hypothetical protein
MPAEHRPNFTGVWQLDAMKSHMLGRPFTRMIAKINHREPTLAQTVVVIDANGGKQQRCWSGRQRRKWNSKASNSASVGWLVQAVDHLPARALVDPDGR